jgi:HD superfamily phosphohydrolase
MPKGPIQRVQDSVHGLMEFRGMDTLVIEILRTPEIQRLRRIRQLGLGHLVFPGAEHSRLVHSLGAAYLAIRFSAELKNKCADFMSEILCPSDIAIRDLAIASLCHDLGHGPLSHAFEREVIGEHYDFVRWCNKFGIDEEDRGILRGAKWHELAGSALLGWKDGQLHKLLESHDALFSKRLRYLLRGEYYLQYLPRLLSGDVDVDRADFIRRDTHQTGVAYGRYDLDWLISTCTVGKLNDRQWVVGFDKRKSPRVVEQFLIARKALYDTVYYHKTVRSAEGMVGLFLRRLRDLWKAGVAIDLGPMGAVYSRLLSGEPIDQRELLSLDDFSLFVIIERASTVGGVDPTIRDLGARILSRDLFKIVPVENEKLNRFLKQPDAYPRMHGAIQPFCQGDPRYYVHVDQCEFQMFCNKPSERGYFIDENRVPTLMRESEELSMHSDTRRELIRVFTLSEAVDALRHAIEEA